MNRVEALERLKQYHSAYNGYPYNQYTSSTAVIKKDLDSTEKELKAFVIITILMQTEKKIKSLKRY